MEAKTPLPREESQIHVQADLEAEAEAPSAPSIRVASLKEIPNDFRRLGVGLYKHAHRIWELRAAEDGDGYTLTRKEEERAVDLRDKIACHCAGHDKTAQVIVLNLESGETSEPEMEVPEAVPEMETSQEPHKCDCHSGCPCPCHGAQLADIQDLLIPESEMSPIVNYESPLNSNDAPPPDSEPFTIALVPASARYLQAAETVVRPWYNEPTMAPRGGTPVSADSFDAYDLIGTKVKPKKRLRSNEGLEVKPGTELEVVGVTNPGRPTEEVRLRSPEGREVSISAPKVMKLLEIIPHSRELSEGLLSMPDRDDDVDAVPAMPGDSAFGGPKRTPSATERKTVIDRPSSNTDPTFVPKRKPLPR